MFGAFSTAVRLAWHSDAESVQMEAAVPRPAAFNSHCISRNLYDGKDKVEPPTPELEICDAAPLEAAGEICQCSNSMARRLSLPVALEVLAVQQHCSLPARARRCVLLTLIRKRAK